MVVENKKEENMTLESLIKIKTKEEVVKWANDFGKCPYNYKLESESEDTCKSGEDQAQCTECWKKALKDVKCKGSRSPKTKEDLAAKDSNEGVKALKDLCKNKAKEEFLEFIKENKICPSMYGLPSHEANCQKHVISKQCVSCWIDVLGVINFKATAEIDKPDEVKEVIPTVDTTELIAPANTTNVATLSHMDKLVEEIKNLEAQKKTWSDMLKAKIQEATSKVNAEIAKLDSAVAFNKAQLKVDFTSVEAKETKTQLKVSLISGDVVLKKATAKLDYDKDKLLKYAQNEIEKLNSKYSRAVEILNDAQSELDLILQDELNNGPDDSSIAKTKEAVKKRDIAEEEVEKLDQCANWSQYIKTKEEFDWAKYKAILEISENEVVDTITGAVLKIDGLSVIDVVEELIIK